MARVRGVPLLALLFAVACENNTAPDGAEPDKVRPSFQEGPSDQPCVGTLPPGTYQNVFVPPGEACILDNSTLTGNLTAFEKSTLLATNNTVAGNIQGDKADIVQLFFGTVGGNVIIKESTFTPSGLVAAFMVGTVLSQGNVEIQKNVANAIRISGVRLDKGTMKIEDNVVEVFDITIAANQVAQNLQVFKNKGAGAKSVSFNIVRQDLQCFENDPPFVGGPNTAEKAEGQCFAGAP